MMVDTTVYGWLTGDGDVRCADCVGLDTWTPGLGRILAEDVRPLYSTDDTHSGGLACDGQDDVDCSGWVFTPSCHSCYADWDDEGADLEPTPTGDEYLCAECRSPEEEDR